MDYIKIRFVDNPEGGESEFRRTVEEMLRAAQPRFSFSRQQWRPQIDIYETREEIVILAEIAGVPREEIHLEIGKGLRHAGGRTARGKCPLPARRNPLRPFRAHPHASCADRHPDSRGGLPGRPAGDPSRQTTRGPHPEDQHTGQLILLTIYWRFPCHKKRLKN
jgi:hypothetical protein